MLLELGKAVSFAVSLLSLYPAMYSAFFVPGARWEDRLEMSVERVLLSGCLCLASGLLFAWPERHKREGHEPALMATLPMRMFFCALAGMVLLFATSWYLDTYYVPLLWKNQPH
jgi:hypothetical protein